MVNLTIRPIENRDLESCGRIMFQAFKVINESHGFQNLEVPTLIAGNQIVAFYVKNPLFSGLVAEQDERIVGFVFIDERSSLVCGIANICVDPAVQSRGVGRRLMEKALQLHMSLSKKPGARLVQHSFNTHSFALYSSLGFDLKEPIVLISGQFKSQGPVVEIEVRAMKGTDLEECAQLCQKVLGFDRTNELKDALRFFNPYIALRDGHVVSYLSAAKTWPQNHGIAETEEDMKNCLLGIAILSKAPISFLVPARQSNFLRWCLEEGLKVIKPMGLMVRGEYQDPNGCYICSIVY